MKFGETLYQRSVPKWAAYNLNYNELKHLIKTRTSDGLAVPVAIPNQSSNKWAALENELYAVLQEQYNNIGLFLRSKYGEIERRLIYLEKQVRSVDRSLNVRSSRLQILARKQQRLIQECDDLGEDIQNLSRFAATQKTAFRKILKKYRKWTGSTSLQTRMESDLFTDGQLQLDFTNQMERLSDQTAIIAGQFQPMVRGRAPTTQDDDDGHLGTNRSTESAVSLINEASRLGQLNYDAAFAATPFGKAAGTALYWIHPDNFEEAQVLLLRYMHSLFPLDYPLSRSASNDGTRSPASPICRDGAPMSAVFCDNIQRFVQNKSSQCPSKIALCGRWSQSSESIVTMSDLMPRSNRYSTIALKRKDLGPLLAREETKSAKTSEASTKLKEFLGQHRDIKPLATMHSTRSRYAGATNSAEIGTWAVLDRDIIFAPLNKHTVTADLPDLETGSAFPHAVLEIRWEFGRKPEVVRAFDATHLAEAVEGFSIEGAALSSQYESIARPSWSDLLERDIRKVPMNRLSGASSRRHDSSAGATSGPSSAGDSIFSLPNAHSTTGSETSPTISSRGNDLTANTSMSEPKKETPVRKKKKARIHARSPAPSQARYYSEYDDPESELNQDNAYVIYVDPDEKAPGAEMFAKIYSGGSKVASWIWPVQRKHGSAGERSPLLKSRRNRAFDEVDVDSSDSDSGLDTPPYKTGMHHRVRLNSELRLNRRQRAMERTMQQTCAGLLGLGYVLLLMSTVLLATGRKKEALEVDVGAIVGIIAALVCGFGGLALAFMRKAPLGAVEWGLLSVAVAGIVIFGAGLAVVIFARVS